MKRAPAEPCTTARASKLSFGPSTASTSSPSRSSTEPLMMTCRWSEPLLRSTIDLAGAEIADVQRRPQLVDLVVRQPVERRIVAVERLRHHTRPTMGRWPIRKDPRRPSGPPFLPQKLVCQGPFGADAGLGADELRLEGSLLGARAGGGVDLREQPDADERDGSSRTEPGCRRGRARLESRRSSPTPPG